MPSLGGSAVEQDPFLKNIQALRSYLALSDSSSPSKAPLDNSRNDASHQSRGSATGISVDDLQRQIKVLSLKLQDALKDSERERQLRASLETAFDRLSENRNQLKRHLDQALACVNNTSTKRRLGSDETSAVSPETRILTLEVEKIEALRACEQANKRVGNKDKQLDEKERQIQDLQAQLKSQDQSFSDLIDQQKNTIQNLQYTKSGLEIQSKGQQTQLAATQAQLALEQTTLQEVKGKLEKLETQGEQDKKAIASLEKDNQTLKRDLEEKQTELADLEEQLKTEKDANKGDEQSLKTVKADQQELEKNLQATRNELDETKEMAKQMNEMLQTVLKGHEEEKVALNKQLAEKETKVQEQTQQISEMEHKIKAIDRMVHVDNSNSDSIEKDAVGMLADAANKRDREETEQDSDPTDGNVEMKRRKENNVFSDDV